MAILPEADSPCPLGKELIVSGWGLDMSNGPPPKTNRYLHAVKQECLDVEECPSIKADDGVLLCVGDSTTPVNSACMGDSGGKK